MAAISRAQSAGVNFSDTAQEYGFGRSERLLGRALAAELRSARDTVVIAAKGGLRDGRRTAGPRRQPRLAAERRRGHLEPLGTDYIDPYQVHWPDPATPIDETAAALAELICEGLIRHVGVSNYTPEQITEFAAVLPAGTVQPPYHLFRRGIEASLLPYAQAYTLACWPTDRWPTGCSAAPSPSASPRSIPACRNRVRPARTR